MRIASAEVLPHRAAASAARPGSSSLESYADRITRPCRSGLHRSGLGLAAVAMILLPTAYIGLVVVVGWGVLVHSVGDVGLVGAGFWLATLLYVGPILVGLTVIAFLLKPLFAARPAAPPAVALVGAPLPRRVEVNCVANAAAGFRRGLASFFGHDLTLTIGLPLVAGLSTRQFAGVLAHEFGHFTQGAGMRLSYLIREINCWFFRVVHERDRWDVDLERAAQRADVRTALLIYPALGCVTLSRSILWFLMQVGHPHPRGGRPRHDRRVPASEAATVLFRDFASLCRRVTRHSYEREYRLPVQHRNVVDTEIYLRESSAARAAEAASTGYFDGVNTAFHPLSISRPRITPSGAEAEMAELRSARDRMKAAVRRARSAGEVRDRLETRLVQASRALALATAGVPFRPEHFGLRAGTRECAARSIERLETERRRADAALEEFSACAGARLGAALRQLDRPGHAGRIPEAARVRAEVPPLVEALPAVARALPTLFVFGRTWAGCQALLANRATQRDAAKVDQAVGELVGRMWVQVTEVRLRIGGIAYPFPHARGAITPDRFVEPETRGKNQGDAVVHEAWPVWTGSSPCTTSCSAVSRAGRGAGGGGARSRCGPESRRDRRAQAD
jgi:hypothetical protein